MMLWIASFVVVLLSIASILCDPGGWTAATVGLALGALLGPARIAGVDFRQWFRDPGTPSELGDDTYIGLVRTGFRALWLGGLGGLVLLMGTTCHWSPGTCSDVDLFWFADVLFWPLSAIAYWVAAALKAHPGIVWGGKILFATFGGIIVSQAVIEIVWHLGLKFGLPAPRHIGFLSSQRLMKVRVKDPARVRRRLLICCDGTWNWPESRRETNVVRLVRSLEPQAEVQIGEEKIRRPSTFRRSFTTTKASVLETCSIVSSAAARARD